MRYRKAKQIAIVLCMLIVCCGLSVQCYRLTYNQQCITDYKNQLEIDLSYLVHLSESILSNDSSNGSAQTLYRTVMEYRKMEERYYVISPFLTDGGRERSQWGAVIDMIVADFVNFDFSKDLSYCLSAEEREVLKKIDSENRILYDYLQTNPTRTLLQKELSEYHGRLEEIIHSYRNRWLPKV